MDSEFVWQISAVTVSMWWEEGISVTQSALRSSATPLTHHAFRPEVGLPTNMEIFETTPNLFSLMAGRVLSISIEAENSRPQQMHCQAG